MCRRSASSPGFVVWDAWDGSAAARRSSAACTTSSSFHIDSYAADPCGRGCRRKRRAAARSSNSAASRPGRSTAARRSGCGCSTNSAATCATRGGSSADRPASPPSPFSRSRWDRRQYRHLQPDGSGALEGDAGPRSAAASAVHVGVRPERVDELVVGHVDRRQPRTGRIHDASFSYAVFEAFERAPAPFERVFAVKPVNRVTVTIDDRAELVLAHLVSGGFYEGVGVVPIAGRPILPSDDKRGRAETVATISDGFWARRFGRDPAVIGRSIRVNGVPVTIVGVNPPGFAGLQSDQAADLFMPISIQARRDASSHPRLAAGQPRRLVGEHHRTAETGRDRRPGRARAPDHAAGHRARDAARSPRSRSAAPAPAAWLARPGQSPRELRQAAVRAAVARRLRAAARVYERREPVAGARVGAAAGVEPPAGARRGPGAAHASVADRRARPRPRRRRAWSAVRLLGARRHPAA